MLFLISLFAESAWSVPIYLSPESVYPSGNYSREWLSEKTLSRHSQRWFRVRSQKGQTGWVPEDHVLTSLRLSTHARTNGIVDLLRGQELNSMKLATLGANVRVRMMESSGRWSLVEVDGSGQTGYVINDLLRPDFETRARGFVKEPAHLQREAKLASDTLRRIRTGEIVEILHSPRNSQWSLVQHRGAIGYVRRHLLIAREDIPPQSVLVSRHFLPIRKASAPFADVVFRAQRFENLRWLDSRIEEWGMVRVRREGVVWWPMTTLVKDPTETTPKRLQLSTQQLFRRKIFDMASNPANPNLKFASAAGIFRTTNGQTWTKIEMFAEQNHPIAVSSTGRVFVGPYVSDDQGQNFEQYIRWDLLMNTVRKQRPVSEHQVRILETKPLDRSGNRLQLRLDIGHHQPIEVQTSDLGQSWKTL